MTRLNLHNILNLLIQISYMRNKELNQPAYYIDIIYDQVTTSNHYFKIMSNSFENDAVELLKILFWYLLLI